MKTIKIDYLELRNMDHVLIGGSGMAANAIRYFQLKLRHGRYYALKNFRDKNIPIHCGFIVGYGQIGEMIGKNWPWLSCFEINNLIKYEKKPCWPSRSWVSGIYRHPVYNDLELRVDRMREMLQAEKEKKKYDYTGALKVAFHRAKDHKNKCYCSEHDYELTSKDIRYPKFFEDICTPYDYIYMDCGWEKIL